MTPNHGLQRTLEMLPLARLRFAVCFNLPSARYGVVPSAAEPER
jgi:hypothetical protein